MNVMIASTEAFLIGPKNNKVGCRKHQFLTHNFSCSRLDYFQLTVLSRFQHKYEKADIDLKILLIYLK